MGSEMPFPPHRIVRAASLVGGLYQQSGRTPALLLTAALSALLLTALACGRPESPQVEQPDSAVGSETLLDSILREDDPTELSSFRQLLDRDEIAPIYTPQFVAAGQSGLDPGELVIGVHLGGESRAYPIRYLRWREMVNDVVGGTPILVTW